MTVHDRQLPAAAPSEAGIDADRVAAFLRAARDRGLVLDSLLVHRAGRLAVEQHRWPHGPERPHMLHSATKSFVGTAVGFALHEGLLHLDDPMAAFFPGRVPPDASAHLRAITVADLLTMRTGHTVGLSGKTWRLLTTPWVDAFLAADVEHPPGQAFTYSSATSHMLSAIVGRASGETVADYLEPRLFAPLGFRGHSWDTDPEGNSSGGNGLSLRSADFLAWGLLHLQDGRWNGRQVLPEGWAREASARRVDHAGAGAWNGTQFVPEPSAPGERRTGYGYQVWLDGDGGYRASGMFGQDVFVLPRHDTVVAVTASIAHGRDRALAGLVHELLVPAFDGTGAPSPEADARLAADTAGLSPKAPPIGPSAAPAHDPAGRRFRCAPNEDGLTALAFHRDGDDLVVAVEDGRGHHQVRCGTRSWTESRTSVTGWQLHHSYQSEAAVVLAGARWADPQTLVLDWWFAESPFHDTVTATFSADGAELHWDRETNANSGPTRRPTISARADAAPTAA